ncbi:MAG: N-glycosylase/DNA lyase [archaeon]|nr:MAG: N-glycosylase/DNA lyase [archaeon]
MNLVESYNKRKKKIRGRLEEFRDFWNKSDEDLFAELCFCLCTPQSKARNCDAFIRRVKENRLLFGGTEKELRRYMLGVRFCDNKSRYIVGARDFFSENGKVKIKERIKNYDPKEARDWLVKNVKGLGFKESSHFLRNIGMGKDLAILDRHVLKNLRKHGVIKDIPVCLTGKRYLEIEEKMKKFSRHTGIPMEELDLLFWSEETGEIFK